MATQAVSAAQEYLEVLVDGTWERFHELKSSPEIGESTDKIDVTSFESEMKEYIKDIPDQAADLEFTMNAMPTGSTDSNYDLLKKLSRNGVYQFRYGLPQMGIAYIITGQFSYRMGAGSVSTVKDIILTIYPRARPNDTPITATYTVTYESNGGTGTVSDTTEYDSGTEVTVLSADGLTAPEGKVFLTWSTSSDGLGQSYDSGDTFTIYGDTTLYAIWSDSDAS